MTGSAVKKLIGQFGAILGFILLAVLFPLAAKAEGITVYAEGQTLVNDGTYELGGGTAVMDNASGTLTLENVNLTSTELTVATVKDSSFTLIFKGTNTIGSESNPIGGGPGGAIQTSGGNLDLNVEIQEGHH